MEILNYPRLREELIRDEGVRFKPYRDSRGYLTIGTGRNLDAIGISQQENDLMLDNDIQRAAHDLDQHCPWWRTLDAVRQRILMNLCFNLGIAKLLQFTQTLHATQQGAYPQAAIHMLDSAWARQVKERALRLAHGMRSGVLG